MPFISMPLLNLLSDSKFESAFLASIKRLCIHPSRHTKRAAAVPTTPKALQRIPVNCSNPKLRTSYKCSAKFPRSSKVRPQRRPSVLGTILEE
ncbi:hypothetical protein DSO57_1031008 [Entomophthora muscae]|uniref:Uncharacterized protein n=2 Tax=Entomophthora muscae TaxID=34485 RepID=A0ACC2SYM4_9FUNG|nr:hypothetical protein DSO57_1038626 [Entomophthora muscae]KAJ9072064.1 hypothetical protein DSO57_1031008 [Entomophthora muscae]